MAVTIENGTGVTGADSFITAAELDAYELDYFGATGTETVVLKEAALRRAWVYLKSLNWLSTAPFPTFSTDDPPAGTVPEDVKLAQALLAIYETDNPNGLQPSVVPSQQKVLNRVGDIGWQVTGASGVSSQRAVVTMADDLLKPYLAGAAGFLLRA